MHRIYSVRGVGELDCKSRRIVYVGVRRTCTTSVEWVFVEGTCQRVRVSS
jgi:hypothetical protein